MDPDPYQIDEDNWHHVQLNRAFWWAGMLWPLNLVLYSRVTRNFYLATVLALCSMFGAFVVAGLFEIRCDTRASVHRYAVISSGVALVVGLVVCFTAFVITR